MKLFEILVGIGVFLLWIAGAIAIPATIIIVMFHFLFKFW